MTNKTLESFFGDELASSVFTQKYAITTKEGEVLESTFNEAKQRIKSEILKCEKEKFNLTEQEIKKLEIAYDNILGNDKTTYFLPGGRILYALGNPYDDTATFSNCYVSSLEEDSIPGIFELAKKIAVIFSRGGGVGFDISKLRPKGSLVNNSAKTTTGAVSFMDLYSTTTDLIGQHGRRGALMIMMNCTHPDILDFIKIKGGEDKTKVQRANISVKCTNDFFNAVLENKEWITSYKLKDGTDFTKIYQAKELWNELLKSNYNGGEPGIVFWDTMEKGEPAYAFPETRPICTNPCGEIPLQNGGSCLLGSVNFSAFVKAPFANNAEFDFETFRTYTRTAFRFLDNVLELNIGRHPLEENNITSKQSRKIGLGPTGIADMLIKMNLKYDTDKAIEFVDKVMKEFKTATILESIDLAVERGEFPILTSYRNKPEFNDFVNHPYFDFLKTDYPEYYEKLLTTGIRNCGWSTCAPNGSLALILRGSSGIEPIFRLSYERTKINSAGVKEQFTVYHPLVEEYNSLFGKDTHLESNNFITSDKIDWNQRVKMQAVIQKYISSSISSTVNLPKDTSIDIIENVYLEAWKQGLKGITIYRDGSREGVLNETKKHRKKKYEVLEETHFPEECPAVMKTIKSEGRKWYLHFSLDPETELPNSLFVNTNNTESEILTNDLIERLEELAEKYIRNGHLQKLKEKHYGQKNVTKICRTLSLLLRHRVPIIDIINCLDEANLPVYSFAYQIKKLLATFIENEPTGDSCPDCKEKLVYIEGCKTCQNCGYSKCGG